MLFTLLRIIKSSWVMLRYFLRHISLLLHLRYIIKSLVWSLTLSFLFQAINQSRTRHFLLSCKWIKWLLTKDPLQRLLIVLYFCPLHILIWDCYWSLILFVFKFLQTGQSRSICTSKVSFGLIKALLISYWSPLNWFESFLFLSLKGLFIRIRLFFSL